MRAALIRLERNIQLTAKECAIRAGYESGSAHSRANELLDFRKYPEVTRAIEEGLVGHKEIWLVDKERHLANLTRIGNEARAKGMYGVAGKLIEPNLKKLTWHFVIRFLEK